MIKESFISLYLFLFKAVFSFFNLFPLKDKTVFLSTFGNNALYIAKELTSHTNHPLIFVNQKRCKIDFSTLPAENKKIYSFETINLKDTVLSIYHLATAKYVFVDNYIGVLSVTHFRKEVQCVQLWHAAGAIKKFGWSDPKTGTRNARAKKRFQEVYNRFHFIPVGSMHMAEIFSKSFNLDSSRFLYTGVPQTDFYFDSNSEEKSLERVSSSYPVTKGKKVILYAPTFREGHFNKMDIQLNVEELLENLDEDYVILIRLHPSVQEAAQVPNHPRVILVSEYPYVNELLIASDILVTDYSSIPFEFSFLRKKMIFFTYDLESYSRTHGLWAINSHYFPGPMARNTSEVIKHIADPVIDYDMIDDFRNYWNSFSTGQSSRRLISAIYKTIDL